MSAGVPWHEIVPVPRGWLSESILAARLGEEFSLDIPFHRTGFIKTDALLPKGHVALNKVDQFTNESESILHPAHPPVVRELLDSRRTEGSFLRADPAIPRVSGDGASGRVGTGSREQSPRAAARDRGRLRMGRNRPATDPRR